MHERALMRDVMSRIEEIARQEGATRITRVDVRLGALSHFTADHFLEHYSKPPIRTKATHVANQAALRTLRPAFGKMKLADINSPMIELE